MPSRPLQQRAARRKGPRKPGPIRIAVLHGPNLNLLGGREAEHYGTDTLEAIDRRLEAGGRKAGIEVATFQSNSEAALVERVQAAKSDGTSFIVINPAAFTHTSVALRDALSAVRIPFIEVHLSNVHAREPYRRESFVAPVCVGTIGGFGARSYTLALDAVLDLVEEKAHS